MQGWKQLGWGVLIFLILPCSAMASLNGWRSVSTEEPVSGEGLARLGASTANRGLVLLLLGGGALPQRKLIKSSLRMVLRRFFTHANTSCKQTNVSIMKVCVHVFPSFAPLNTVHIADTQNALTRVPCAENEPCCDVGDRAGCPDQSFSGGPQRFLIAKKGFRMSKTTQRACIKHDSL